MTTTTIEQTTTDLNDSHGLGERVRSRLPVALVTFEQRARTQWLALPAQMREALDHLLDQALGRVRSTLDIPTRGDVSDLLVRIEKLDAKLAALAQAKPAAKAKAKKPATANKTARRGKIATAAKKRAPKR